MAKTHNSGRKPAKPEYSAEKNLTNQMNAAVALYKSDMTLQAIAEELSLNPIKVRKLLITAGVYRSDIADAVQQTFQPFRTTQDYRDRCVFHHGCPAPISPLSDLLSAV